MPKGLPRKIYNKCTNLEKQLIGFCSIPPKDEKQRINTKMWVRSVKLIIYESYTLRKTFY